MKDVTSSGVFIINPRTEPPVGSNYPTEFAIRYLRRSATSCMVLCRSKIGIRGSDMAYEVEGQLLEVCTCNILCPCWVGEDPDNGTCDGLLGWHITKGSINGTSVVGHSIVALAHIPGNILKGNWKVRMYIDDKASAAQKDAILAVWSGKLGGPIADMAKLIGEVISVERSRLHSTSKEWLELSELVLRSWPTWRPTRDQQVKTQ